MTPELLSSLSGSLSLVLRSVLQDGFLCFVGLSGEDTVLYLCFGGYSLLGCSLLLVFHIICELMVEL